MPPRPNILVIMSDQHARGKLGCYGDPLVRTPNLDRLAAQGMRFSNAYCPAPLCVPSRMSFMTGRRPSGNRIWTNTGALPSDIPTWAHALGAGGYDTALVGRMHFVGPDQRHGFMERPIGESCARFPGAPEQGGPRYTRLPQATAGQKRHAFEYAGKGNSFYQHYGEEVTDKACEFLRQRGQLETPFAATVGYILPHCPFIGDKAMFDFYYERVDTTVEMGSEPDCIRAVHKTRDLLPAATEQQLRVARAAYCAMIEKLDQHVGRVLDALDESGLADHTLVVYCSDHGEMLGEHGLWSKKCYYEDSAGIPLIARLPGVTPAGSVNATLCNLVDLAPTFVDLAQAPAIDTDGASLLPLLRGAEDPGRITASEVADVNGGSFEWVGKMARKGAWKLWQHRTVDGEDYPPVLFNLDDDPREQHNLAGRDDCRQVQNELSGLLQEGWEPDRVIAHVRQELRDHKLLKAWGQTVRPTHPDTYRWPGEETEADLELL